MKGRLEFSSYRIKGHDELCLRMGLSYSKQLILIQPLFDEMNRMRRLLVEVMRRLDDRQIGTLLPDLPGMNESLVPLADVDMTQWQEALKQCAQQHGNITHIAAFRGGCLIDHALPVLPCWRLAPAAGKSLLRTLLRTRLAADKESGKSSDMTQLTDMAESEPVNLAGHIINPKLFAQLQQSTSGKRDNIRIAQLESRAKPDEVAIAGSALWLRAEPDDDAQLAAAIAADIAAWVTK